ncbi:MAG: DUF4286 family protein [Flavobacteriales bacterium]|nr:DUF4286 family protein [Flavobacteriales bacterium]
MLIYNVTVNVDEDTVEDWLQWMRSVHIPDVLNTGCFLECRLTKIMAYEEGGKSFSIQYLAESKELFDQYQSVFAPALQAEHTDRYNGKFAAFRTLLDVVEISKPASK